MDGRDGVRLRDWDDTLERRDDAVRRVTGWPERRRANVNVQESKWQAILPPLRARANQPWALDRSSDTPDETALVQVVEQKGRQAGAGTGRMGSGIGPPWRAQHVRGASIAPGVFVGMGVRAATKARHACEWAVRDVSQDAQHQAGADLEGGGSWAALSHRAPPPPHPHPPSPSSLPSTPPITTLPTHR